ncbi:MAG: metal-sensing transcriptional repressor [Candidatus Methanomethylophilaceae archaeon]|nr:metal-sensing transcriptional repressor [Candidatus Methanomethylophilaceae archaeon]
MRQCMDSDNLHRRLKKISGQVAGLDKLIDEDVPCADILVQVNAISSALHKVGEIILVGHINHCVKDGLKSGDVDKTLADFEEVLRQYSKI